MNISLFQNLDGRNTKLYSSHSEKNLVMDLSTLRIYFDNSSNINISDIWNIIPVEEENVLFKNKHFYVCHFPDDNGNVSIIEESQYSSENEKYCKWKIGKSGEIYHLTDTNEEKYLWVADDNLHVISDGYLADKWSTNPSQSLKKTSSSGLYSSLRSLYIVIIIFCCAIIIYFISKIF
jgi:hypothetical protein